MTEIESIIESINQLVHSQPKNELNSNSLMVLVGKNDHFLNIKIVQCLAAHILKEKQTVYYPKLFKISSYHYSEN